MKSADLRQTHLNSDLCNNALSDQKKNLSTSIFQSENIGANSYREDNAGYTAATSLDILEIDRKIDFIKIDTEGMENGILKGAKKTIQKNLPGIFVEIATVNYEEVHSFLTELGYKQEKQYSKYNFLYLPD